MSSNRSFWLAKVAQVRAMARRIAARLIEMFSTFPISLQSAEWARHSAALIIEASMSSPPAETGCALRGPIVDEIQESGAGRFPCLVAGFESSGDRVCGLGRMPRGAHRVFKWLSKI